MRNLHNATTCVVRNIVPQVSSIGDLRWESGFEKGLSKFQSTSFNRKE